MKRVMSATEARMHFGELMRRVVEDRDAVVVERGGEPQVVVVSVAEYERMSAGRQEQPHWKHLLDEAHAQIRQDKSGPLTPPPDQVIREMREERDAQLMDLH